MRARGPHFLSSDDDLVTVDDAASVESGQIRPGVGFREALAIAIRSVDDTRQEVRPLLVGAVHDDRRSDEPLTHAARDAGDSSPAELLIHHGDFDPAEPAAAVLSWPTNAEEAGLVET